jgi:hypothetical protein
VLEAYPDRYVHSITRSHVQSSQASQQPTRMLLLAASRMELTYSAVSLDLATKRIVMAVTFSAYHVLTFSAK